MNPPTTVDGSNVLDNAGWGSIRLVEDFYGFELGSELVKRVDESELDHLVNGHVAVPAGGQLKAPTLR